MVLSAWLSLRIRANKLWWYHPQSQHREGKAGESTGQGHTQLHSKFQATLGLMKKSKRKERIKEDNKGKKERKERQGRRKEGRRRRRGEEGGKGRRKEKRKK